MATEVTYHIGVGHERPGYDTLGAWVTGTQINCVSSGVIIVGQLSHAQRYDEDVIVIAGATVDASNYRVLRPAASSIGDATAGSGPRVYSDVGSFGAVINVNENFFRVEDIEIESDGIGVMYGIFQNVANTDLYVSGVLVNNCHYGGMFIQNSGTVYNSFIHSCGAYDGALGAIQGNSSDTGKVMVVHTTALREELDDARQVTGFRYVTVKNTIACNYGGSAGHQDYLNLGANSTNYGASDANGSTAELSNLDASGLFVSTTSGSYDLHLTSNLTAVAGSGTGLGISEGIDGNARDLTNPDLGADEFLVILFGEQVFTNDVGLVALYRYDDGPYISGTYPVLNQAIHPAYLGMNTLVSSGRFDGAEDAGIKDDGPTNTPNSSNQWFGSGIVTDGFGIGDFFDLSATSGNMSGMSAVSGESISVGTWVKVSGWDESGDINFVSRYSDVGAGDGLWFILYKEFNNITKFQQYIFQFGTESGAASEWVRSTDQRVSGVWQHVVGVVDSGTSSAKIYVDGVDATLDSSSGPKIYAPQGSGTALDGIIPMRIGTETYDSTDLWGIESFGEVNVGSGWLGETFIMNRAITDNEASGIYLSGFLTESYNNESDTNDTLKDNIGEISSTLPELVLTAWNPRQQANPSGMRQITSGVHPSFIKLLGNGIVSGLLFPAATNGSVSEPVAVSIRANTNDKLIKSMSMWLVDDSAFTGVDGYEVSTVVASEWLPNIAIPSGSGVMGRTLADAIIVLRSDQNSTISGVVTTDQSASGETGVDISQYIYMAFDTNSDFTPGTYGPTGFQFKISIDFEDV